MPSNVALFDHDELDEFVRAFEEAHARGAASDLGGFLPPPEHPLRAEVLRELVRVDLEFRWEDGCQKALAEYLHEFPELERDEQGLRAIAFEQSRLYGPTGSASSTGGVSSPWSSELGSGAGRKRRPWLAGGLVRSGSDSGSAGTLSRVMAALPKGGDDFLGFQLIRELGRGAFGKVFLARQGDLADRPVALKVSAEFRTEPQALARLQHTNIVPIYSIHHIGPFQAVCMPYFGSTTLRDVVRDLKERGTCPDSGQELVRLLSPTRGASPLQAELVAPGSESEGACGPLVPVPLSVSVSDPAAVEVEVVEAGAAAPPPQPQSATLCHLEKLSYVDAILWLMSRLSDGLAHAHERGILHRDLKPANILLTDDGQPMLLDFNLAADLTLRARVPSAVGGTLLYMAPEHIDAFGGGTARVDQRSDIYSLGVILYELLTGRVPFAHREGPEPYLLGAMIADRLRPPLPVRVWNPAVSPAVESIVRHCLEADPDRRYQGAMALREDLDRHLANRPLRHAPEPSARERARKWVRRHPRLASSTSIGTIALVIIVALSAVLTVQGQRWAEREAVETLDRFQVRMADAQLLLNIWIDDGAKRREGLASAYRLLDSYRIPRAAAGPGIPSLDHLPREARQRLRDEIGELFFLIARGLSRDAASRPDPAERRALAESALARNELAAAYFAPDAAPAHALLMQRAKLLGTLGRDEEAARVRAAADRTPPKTVRDYYLVGAEHAIHGHYRQAVLLLERAERLDPGGYWAWYLSGFCYDRLGRDVAALTSYTTCIALRPDRAAAWFNRGLVSLKRKDYRRAMADFDRVVVLLAGRTDTHLADAYLNRGITEKELGQYPEAIRDLTNALEFGAPYTRIYFARAEAREHVGDREGARRDRDEGWRRDPVDEPSWVARGVARVKEGRDLEEALVDFDRALKLNPASLPALMNKAVVYSERLARPEPAIAALDRLIELYPDFVPARSSRGVLKARLGRRDEALVDAEETLARDPAPPIYYQLACIYALTSRDSPADRAEAFRLLNIAVRGGYGCEKIEDDHDLDPIRDRSEFLRLLAVARALRAGELPPENSF
jgi:serine/threonine protein kinase/Flp pilus assembly protein TadD